MKRQRLEAGESVLDLSIGAPNIPPAKHILDVLCKEAADKNNYIYAINDQKDLLQAVSGWYERRYGVALDPDTEICSLLGSQEGLAHIAMSIVDEGDLVLVPDPCYPVFAEEGKWLCDPPFRYSGGCGTACKIHDRFLPEQPDRCYGTGFLL